ncbi:MAG: type II toxin-antitoxin system RelB/DinJ family antitoxin [Clostridia bacterium]|nr:type II toxin-antitoxin system RelB/DinJ family antitoxin [Clostridia bacterium]
MATVQIRVDDALKARADVLFNSLGMDTTTAVRMFFVAAIERDGIPFDVRHDHSLAAAIRDSRERKNLIGPFDSAEAAVAAMLED